VSFPKPVAGLVIRYSCLWLDEHRKGQDEGVKDRPCAVILVTANEDGRDVVTVLPVTHTPPSNTLLAIEIPAATKRRLRLDDDRSWVILTEANRFVWPGPDLRPAKRGDASSIAYGLLPARFYEHLKARLLDVHIKREASVIPRTE
jgi:hypothetical protein